MLLPGAADLPLEGVLAHYREHGWARLGPVIAPQALEQLRVRAEEIMLGKVVHQGLFFQHDSATGSYHDLPRRKGYQGPSLGYRKIEKLERDPLFRQLIDNPLFGRVAHALLGPRVTLYRAVLFSKAATGGSNLPWHQDGGSFWGLSRDPELQIWTALDDVPAESGCVELLPRSHLGGLATPLGGVIPDEVVAGHDSEARRIEVPARAGESLLLHNYLWHRSGVNQTGRPRRALTVCLMDAATTCKRRRSPRQFVHLYDGG